VTDAALQQLPKDYLDASRSSAANIVRMTLGRKVKRI